MPGTLAPLFTVGGGVGYAVAAGVAAVLPSAEIDLRIGALVGMAALFAGASRAPLACVVFAFEATRQPLGLLPLLGGCGGAYLLSCVMMKMSIMTEKIARRGRPIPAEYSADQLEQVLVRDVGLRPVVTLRSADPVAKVQAWLRSGVPESAHHGFPVVDGAGHVCGVVTQRDVFACRSLEQPMMALISRSLVGIAPSASLREAADTMLREGIGRLPVIEGGRLLGIVTRSDLLEVRVAGAGEGDTSHGSPLPIGSNGCGALACRGDSRWPESSHRELYLVTGKPRGRAPRGLQT